jgi:iron only hydrogenase large subunit-like protein
LSENNLAKQNNELDKIKTIVVTISQQPLISIAKKYNLEPEIAARHLAGYFKTLGVDLVLDTKLADDLALLESREEFVKRFMDQKTFKLPMLASSCPGFVCYAEKTHGNFILPYISTTRSPQQIMGVLVKQHLSKKLNIDADKIYHITIMPCYDKKLEASREDFFNDALQSRDVDCVITSIEIEQMLTNESKKLNEFEINQFDWPWTINQPKNFFWSHESSGSGGYSDYIFKHAAKVLFNEDVDNLEYKNLRNPDFREVNLEKDGKVVLKFAIANGFRNIQNLVQKLKRSKSTYHYVEVMACPSGCINGGAQIRPETNQPSVARELTRDLEQMYRSLPKSQPDNDDVKVIYEEFLGGIDSDKSHELLHTSYHEVEKMSTALNIKW